MKRILFLTNYPSPYRVEFFDELGKTAEVTVLFSEKAEDQKHRSGQWFLKSKGNFQGVQLEKCILKLRECPLCADVISWLKKPWDHIVICGYSTPTAILAIVYLKMKKIPFLMEADGGLIRETKGLRYRVKRMLITSADGWLTSGQYTSYVFAHYGADREKIYEYPFTSMKASDFPPQIPTAEQRRKKRQELGIREEHMILSVGQFIHRKGFDVLMQAAQRLPENTGIYIVGGLPTEEYLQLHRDLGLAHLYFSGFKKREELRKYYEAADLFVLPTREDIWGLVINEAMAFGLPVITTDHCVAGLELVKDGVNGYLVPAGDADALKEKMLLALASDLPRMGAAARKAVEPYTIENMVKAHESILG